MVLSLLGSEGMLRASAACKRLQAAASMVDEVQFRALRKPMSLPQATRIFVPHEQLCKERAIRNRSCIACEKSKGDVSGAWAFAAAGPVTFLHGCCDSCSLTMALQTVRYSALLIQVQGSPPLQQYQGYPMVAKTPQSPRERLLHSN